MASETSVVVGVRVRPFSDRERKLKAETCIAMRGPTTTITNEAGDKETSFAFDESFWSHDGFVEDDDGRCVGLPGSGYADQQYVFDTFGKRVLDSAWEGFHSCLFAYGQTGAGKSYSMVGYGMNKGIIPIATEEIFTRIESNTNPDKRYEVCVSMVEIYNEAVQDLLIMPDDRPKKGLEIRESKMLGIYIDGVTKRPVSNYDAIEKATEEATEHRTVGATLMNATSSRAHTVLTIEFKQVEVHMGLGKEQCKISLINLVDLAGSEKAAQTGASGDRLKEGCAINVSLTALGNVIEKLADRSQNPKRKGMVIPYRNSKLTRLLQNALGGSSKTIMICALSPASSNYEETLSTLRYADRAKKIKNAAVVNENPQDKLMRELKEENDKLKLMFEANRSTGLDLDSTTVAEMAAKKAELERGERALRDMKQTFEEKLQRERSRQRVMEIRRRESVMHVSEASISPQMVNLNEDRSLNGRVRFSFPEGRTFRIGCGGDDESNSDGDSDSSKDGTRNSETDDDEDSDEDEQPEIQLVGEGVCSRHAKIKNENGVCYLYSENSRAAEATYINGVLFTKRKEEHDLEYVRLQHGDRLVFGKMFFAFVDPTILDADRMLLTGEVSFVNARKEWRRGAASHHDKKSSVMARLLSSDRKADVRISTALSMKLGRSPCGKNASAGSDGDTSDSNDDDSADENHMLKQMRSELRRKSTELKEKEEEILKRTRELEEIRGNKGKRFSGNGSYLTYPTDSGLRVKVIDSIERTLSTSRKAFDHLEAIVLNVPPAQPYVL